MSGSNISFDNQDPILRSIAQELHTTLNQDGIPNATLHGTKEYDFHLQSLVTRPRNCTTLFPPRVLKDRHQKITLQERLLLISVKPVGDPTTSGDSKQVDPAVTSSAVLVAGLEVLEYMLTPIDDAASDISTSSSANNPSGPHQSTPRQERIVYIAKVDTSGCWPLPGLETQSLKSPAQALVKGYLQAMRSQGYECGRGNINAADHLSSLSLSPSNKDEGHSQDHEQGQDQDRRRVTRTSLFVFARSQPQYLFAESAKNIGKRVLDDRGLVRWWKNMITSVYSLPSSPSSSSSSPSSSSPLPSKTQGWWLIPGIETERQAVNVIQSKSPSRTPATATSTAGSPSSTPLSLQYGYSDRDSKEMAYTLIPQFPDDPKSRMIKSPSCQGGFVDIKTFWELAAIGEESGAGKITGFFKVVEDVETPACISSESATKTVLSATAAAATTTTTTTTTACLTGTTSDYTRAINFLLELDFSNHERAQDSTQQWLDRLELWIKKAALKNAEAIDATSSDTVKDVPLQTQLEDPVQPRENPNDKTTEPSITTPPLNRRSSTASPLWIQKGTVRIQLLQAHNASTEQVSATGTVPAGAATSAVVHTLNASLIKRKPIAGGAETPAVHVLGSNLIKRKPAATHTTTATASTTAEPVVASTEPTPATSDSSTPSEPTVNILGSSFIKKRKLDP